MPQTIVILALRGARRGGGRPHVWRVVPGVWRRRTRERTAPRRGRRSTFAHQQRNAHTVHTPRPRLPPPPPPQLFELLLTLAASQRFQPLLAPALPDLASLCVAYSQMSAGQEGAWAEDANALIADEENEVVGCRRGAAWCFLSALLGGALGSRGGRVARFKATIAVPPTQTPTHTYKPQALC